VDDAEALIHLPAHLGAQPFRRLRIERNALGHRADIGAQRLGSDVEVPSHLVTQGPDRLPQVGVDAGDLLADAGDLPLNNAGELLADVTNLPLNNADELLAGVTDLPLNNAGELLAGVSDLPLNNAGELLVDAADLLMNDAGELLANAANLLTDLPAEILAKAGDRPLQPFEVAAGLVVHRRHSTQARDASQASEK